MLSAKVDKLFMVIEHCIRARLHRRALYLCNEVEWHLTRCNSPDSKRMLVKFYLVKACVWSRIGFHKDAIGSLQASLKINQAIAPSYRRSDSPSHQHHNELIAADVLAHQMTVIEGVLAGSISKEDAQAQMAAIEVPKELEQHPVLSVIKALPDFFKSFSSTSKSRSPSSNTPATSPPHAHYHHTIKHALHFSDPIPIDPAHPSKTQQAIEDLLSRAMIDPVLARLFREETAVNSAVMNFKSNSQISRLFPDRETFMEFSSSAMKAKTRKFQIAKIVSAEFWKNQHRWATPWNIGRAKLNPVRAKLNPGRAKSALDSTQSPAATLFALSELMKESLPKAPVEDPEAAKKRKIKDAFSGLTKAFFTYTRTSLYSHYK